MVQFIKTCAIGDIASGSAKVVKYRASRLRCSMSPGLCMPSTTVACIVAGLWGRVVWKAAL